MPVLASAGSAAASRHAGPRERVRMLCRAFILIAAVCQMWALRYVIDSDGTAYADIAHAWLRGDWVNALNSYWSPLYIWLLSAAFGIFHPSIHWRLPLMHLVNLLGFFAAVWAWEWLTSEWEKWQGPPSHPILIDVTGYYVVAWAGLSLVMLGLNENPDVFVLAILIAAAAMLVRTRRGKTGDWDSILFGAILAAGYLAKTAIATMVPIFLIVMAALLRAGQGNLAFFRSLMDRRIAIVALTTFALAAPFITAISINHKRFTIGDSGWLNYSWHVTGVSVVGYMENGHAPGPEIRHPVRVLMQHPQVVSFAKHPFGSLPVHADPAWWCEGYPVRFDKARQLMIISSNIRYSLKSFRCKALLMLLLLLPFGAREMARRFLEAWFIWLPAAFLLMVYLPVFAETRYFAGSYALIGFALIASAWHTRLPARKPLWDIAAVALMVFMAASFRHAFSDFARDIGGSETPTEYGNVQVAENMRRWGLQPDERVAYIGFSLLGMHHIGLDQAHIVATVPERFTHDDRQAGRPLVFTFPKPDEFWRSNSETKRRVFDAFRSVGAKWVFANCVPKWAETKGWQVAGTQPWMPRPNDRPYVYFRKLQ